MKKLRLAVSLLLLTVLLAGLCGQAFADTGYKVRVYGGNSDVGVLDSNPATKTVGYNEEYTLDASKVTVKNPNYYVKGFREAGKDNTTGFYASKSSVRIKRDMDFVVAYGMKGSAVAYTVSFVGEDGTELGPAQTFYANVGDKPIVSYLYVEGYEPQAYALTKTLTENPAENVFTFTYTEIEPVTETTVIVVGGGGAAVPGVPVQPAVAQPEEIIDLDVPLAAPDELGMHGDWKAADSTSMSEEETAAVEKALEGEKHVKYEPVARLTQQEVSGSKYAVLCKALNDKPDAQPYYAVVYFNENPEGDDEVLNIVNLTRNGEVDEKAGDAKQQVGDWTVTEEQEPGVKAFEKATQELQKVKYKPVYVLSSQVVSGTNYCVLAQAKTDEPEAEAYYTLATVHEDLSGKVEITELRYFDIGGLYEENAE